MKAASLRELKSELIHADREDLLALCLQLAKFKKENKELLTYLLFEAHDQDRFIHTVQKEIDTQFESINSKSYFYMKKTIRKILRGVKTNIRYAKNKETEVVLLLYFCEKLKAVRPSIKYNRLLNNLYLRELKSIENKIHALHEDLQYDLQIELEDLQVF
jgi:hypothetical protein